MVVWLGDEGLSKRSSCGDACGGIKGVERCIIDDSTSFTTVSPDRGYHSI